MGEQPHRIREPIGEVRHPLIEGACRCLPPVPFADPARRAAAMSALLDRRPDLDAVVAANDGMALGAMHTLLGRGLRIPEDVAVTGFDDIDEAAWFTPTLTSVGQPLEEMGRQEVRRRWSEFNGSATPAVAIPLRAELMIRESTGAGQSGSE